LKFGALGAHVQANPAGQLVGEYNPVQACKPADGIGVATIACPVVTAEGETTVGVCPVPWQRWTLPRFRPNWTVTQESPPEQSAFVVH